MYIFVVRSHTRSLLAFIAVTVPLADTSNQTRSSRSTLFTFTCFKAFKCKKPKADIIVFWIVFISEIIMRQFWSLSNLLVSICIIAIATASNTFETISDDDLVEKIKSNEFFIALFCKWFWFKVIQFRGIFIISIFSQKELCRLWEIRNGAVQNSRWTQRKFPNRSIQSSRQSTRAIV